jgi:hypothetical protein
MPPDPVNNFLDLCNRFQFTGKYQTPPPACLATLQKKKTEDGRKIYEKIDKKRVFFR